MNIVQKIKKLVPSIDGVNIDMTVLASLDQDKLLKIYNILTQLASLTENTGQFSKILIRELHRKLNRLILD